MSARIKRAENKKGSALLGLAFMLSVSLAIAMTSLIVQTRAAVRRGNSLLSREKLRRMAEEKFLTDLLVLSRTGNYLQLSTSPVVFASGEAASHAVPAPRNLPGIRDGLYLVTVATLTNTMAPPPHIIRLETVLDWVVTESPSSPPPSVSLSSPPPQLTVADMIEERLRSFPFSEEQIQQLKQHVLAELENELGSNAGSLRMSIQTNEYRTDQPIPTEPAEDAFYLSPISVGHSKAGPFVRVWKESFK